VPYSKIISSDSYYPGLTSLRAIAAFMVYLHHVNPFPPKYHMFGLPIWGILNEFHIGVTLFFVLSGFLIATRYFDNTVSFKKYLWNRFTRIYPIYFLITLITFLILGLNGGFKYHLFKIFLLNITFLRGFIESFKFSLVAQGWSLTVEETFYFLAPFIFMLMRKYGRIVYFTPVLLITFGLLLTKIFTNQKIWGGVDFTINYTFLGRCTEFFIGIWIANIVNSGIGKRFYLMANPYLGLIFAIFFACILHFLSLYNNVDFGIRTIPGIVVNTLLIPVFVMGPIILSFTMKQGKYKIFESKFFQIMGKSSYAFYMIHMGIVRSMLQKFGIGNELIILVILLLFAYLLWRFIEEPLNLKLKNILVLS
jgi:peptidoglycan/LPS O-acetylase OafA/YrhL